MIKNFGIDIDKAGEGWVVVFPRGKHYINKYNLVLNCDEKFFSTIKAWWENSTFKKPYLDKGHEFNEKYGDFTDMRITEKGLELFLKLNEGGKELLKKGVYEFLSPTFDDAKDSNGVLYHNVIFTVSLVNYPALLVLDKIQEQIALSYNGESSNKIKLKGGSQMELREIIAKKLKLNLASDDQSIIDRLQQLLDEGATIEDLQAELIKIKDELKATQEQLKASEDSKKAVEAELDGIKKATILKEAEKVIDEAIKFQQFHPSLKELKLELYLKDPEAIKKELAILPKKGTDVQKTVTTTEGGLELSVEDKKILEDAGYDLSKPEDIKLAKRYLESI